MNADAVPDDLLDRVRRLRSEGRSPKAIARTLGIRPSAVTPLLRTIAAETAAIPPYERPLAGCWVSPGWSTGLTVDGHADWPHGDRDAGPAGIAQVLVARRYGPHRVTVCCYLVDVYCLGVKNVFGPEIMDDGRLPTFVPHYFSQFAGPPLEAPPDLARHLVHGAVEHARGLGFEPHPDFAAAADHLGPWDEASAITFGNDGVPEYNAGPYDDQDSVFRTLRESVGDGNFHFTMVIDDPLS